MENKKKIKALTTLTLEYTQVIQQFKHQTLYLGNFLGI